MSLRRRALRALGLVALVAAAPSVARSQEIACDPGDLEVRSLEFQGNEAFSDDQLASGIVTTPSSWGRRIFRFFGARRCVTPSDVRLDSLRLILFYRRHGYPQVRVGTAIGRPAPETIDVTFRIAEGQPVRLAQLTVTGLDSVPDAERFARGLGLRVGDVFDQTKLDTAAIVLGQRLRNAGYPTADVLRNFETDTVQRIATVELAAIPGERMRIGEVVVEANSYPGKEREITDRAVRRVARIRPGELYRERILEDAKRQLYLTDAFRHVDVAPDSSSLESRDSSVAIRIRVDEGLTQSARTLLGWGTLDCFRVQGEYTNLNVLGGARRLDVSGRVSKIGIGAPLAGAEHLCARFAREDFYSDTLNYYAGATLRQSALFGVISVPSLTLYSERRSEYKAFLRQTPIGLLASFSPRREWRYPVSFSYQLELGRTLAEPALFCAAFQVCEEEVREVLRDFKRLAVASAAVSRNRANSLIDPSRGSVARVEARVASTVVGSSRDLQFARGSGDASWYLPVGDRAVLVARLRLGGVWGLGEIEGGRTIVPPQERLYGGGPNTVRGFRQNELGPVAYLVDPAERQRAYDTVTVGGRTYFRAPSRDSIQAGITPLPVGGTTNVVANLEARLRSPVFPELVQWAVFADAGEVWERGRRDLSLGFDKVKVTPGLGVRVFTPVGPVRVDVGYNPYALRRGPAYVEAGEPGDRDRPLYCVSPGNELAVTLDPEGGLATQAAGACPGTFPPESRRGFLRRLTFQFSIGQAF